MKKKKTDRLSLQGCDTLLIYSRMDGGSRKDNINVHGEGEGLP